MTVKISKGSLVWKNYGLLLTCLKNTKGNGKTERGVKMDDVFKDLCTIMKGERSVFHFLSDENIKNLSTFLNK
jgi:hypothetical protein